MAVLPFTPIAWPSGGPTNTLTFVLLDASGEYVAFIVQVPKSGTLHSFEFRTQGVGNNPDNGIRLSFQDLSSGTKDGVQDQFCDITGTISANTWQVPPGPLTDDGTGSGVKRTVTQGDFVACVVDFVSFVASDAFNISLINGVVTTNYYVVHNGSKTAAGGILALKYDDGTYAQFPTAVLPVMSFNAPTFNTGSTPDERALRFQVPAPFRTCGFWLLGDIDNAADVVLYDAASGVLESASLIAANRRHIGEDYHFGYFDTSVELAANTTYRLAVKPTSGSNLTLADFQINSSGLLAACPGGASCYFSSRADAGAWTDDQTKVPYLGLLIDGVDVTGEIGGDPGEAVGSAFGGLVVR